MEASTTDSGTPDRAGAAGTAPPAGARSTLPQEQLSLANRRATIRTYRHGGGDCHLVTLHGDGGKTYRILIDGGAAQASYDASRVREQVMGDILAETGGQVDLLVAMQTHADGSSGLAESAEALAKLNVGEAWMAWTEDPNDPAARALRAERGRTLDKLRLAGAAVQLRGSDAETRAINSLLAFYGVAGRAPTGDPLAAVRAKTQAPVYCRPGDAPRELPGVGARIYVLGPPHSEAGFPARRDAVSSRLALDEFVNNVMSNLDGKPVDNPFSTLYAIPEPVARAMPFFQEHYWEDAPWRRIDTAWISDAVQYALVLDSLTRDTRLGLAIELDGGDVLLFAPDGQVGNWLSPGELGWAIDGRKVDGRDLLTHTVFYKVGHHGSVNATAGNDGLGLMPRLRVAVIPVDQAAALPMGGGDTPLAALQRALAAATGDRGYVLRTDQDAPAVALNRGASATAGYFDVRL
jgi:hypothetical protein